MGQCSIRRYLDLLLYPVKGLTPGRVAGTLVGMTTNPDLTTLTNEELQALRTDPTATPLLQEQAAEALTQRTLAAIANMDTDADEEFDAVGRRRTVVPTPGRQLTTGMTLADTGEVITDIDTSVRQLGKLIVAATRNGRTTAFDVHRDELVNVVVWSVEQA